jgi:hypothetical protein
MGRGKKVGHSLYWILLFIKQLLINKNNFLTIDYFGLY